MMLRVSMIRTKIVATMGPACAEADVLLRLFEAGVDVCRLNFSHGTLEDHLRMLQCIREASQRHKHPIAVLGDLGGPKIRLGQIADHDGTEGMPIKIGDQLTIQRQSILGRDGRVSTTYEHFVDDVQVGDRVLIEDGLLRFVCTDKAEDELRCSCTVGGVLKSRKGINLPHTHVNVPCITDRDWQCTDWAVDNELDYLALSFVRRATDIDTLCAHLRRRDSGIQVIAKIEKAEAIQDIEAIIESADGLMVARGDLGVEVDLARVPIIQKDLIRRCQTAGKPVIVATQMLQSMIEQASPTRAEVSDVANAIFDGTDAVMLSGETSIGRFPVGSVHMMNHVAQETEAYLAQSEVVEEPVLRLTARQLSAAVARGVWQIVRELPVRLVIIWSQTGATARIFSKNRFPIPILALSNSPAALRRMALQYGVLPHPMDRPQEMTDLIEHADRLVQQLDLAKAGDRVVVIAGSSLGPPGTMNSIVVHTVGEHWSTTPASDEDARSYWSQHE
jgi:pyruvate kinase